MLIEYVFKPDKLQIVLLFGHGPQKYTVETKKQPFFLMHAFIHSRNTSATTFAKHRSE